MSNGLENLNLGPRDALVIQWRNGVEVAIHVVYKPLPNEKGFYRQALSFDSFRNRENSIWYNKYYLKNKVRPIHSSISYGYEDPIEMLIRYEQRVKKIDPSFVHSWRKLPIFKHSNVWDFYIAIGYDYKNQRYIL